MPRPTILELCNRISSRNRFRLFIWKAQVESFKHKKNIKNLVSSWNQKIHVSLTCNVLLECCINNTYEYTKRIVVFLGKGILVRTIEKVGGGKGGGQTSSHGFNTEAGSQLMVLPLSHPPLPLPSSLSPSPLSSTIPILYGVLSFLCKSVLLPIMIPCPLVTVFCPFSLSLSFFPHNSLS